MKIDGKNEEKPQLRRLNREAIEKLLWAAKQLGFEVVEIDISESGRFDWGASEVRPPLVKLIMNGPYVVHNEPTSPEWPTEGGER